MDHSVPLDKLPEGLEFPADLQDLIYYDAANQRLVYRGFMSRSRFERLCELHNDYDYRRAIEELFRNTAFEEIEDREKHGWIIVVILAIAAGLVVAGVLWYVIFRG